MSDYHLEIYEEDGGGQPFIRFLEGLPYAKQELLILTMTERLAALGHNLCSQPSHGRALGKRLFEVKTEATENEIVEFFAERGIPLPEGVGGDVMLRTFFHPYGDKRILLLHGYDKGLNPKTSFQTKQIATARKHLKAWMEAEKRRKASDRKRPLTPAERAARAAQDAARSFLVWLQGFRKRKKPPKT